MTEAMVIIIVKNFLGKLFIHQRSASKKIYPLLYGLGAGGHVNVGESPYEAAKRELREELGISGELKELFSFPFSSDNVNHVIHVFETVHDDELNSCDEWNWSGWLNLQEIDKLAEENKLCPDTKILYEKWKLI